MIDGTVLYGAVFRSAAYSGASLRLAIAVATVVSSGEKVKVKMNNLKFSSHDSV